ncbi:MAG: NDP-sugar synthase, partial [Actinomycetota bacterium]|nr:NDP-sugar synthase [Actinomycetota bacterium]
MYGTVGAQRESERVAVKPDNPLRGLEGAVIMAGGRGTRLQPLTHAVPKPLLPFCGAPLLEGTIRRLAKSGIRRVFLVVGNELAAFEPLRALCTHLDVTLEFVPEPTPLGTAGGVRSLAERSSDSLLVLNGDIVTDLDYGAVVTAHRGSGAAVTIVLGQVEDASSYGVALLSGSRIERFIEKPPPGSLPHGEWVNAGTYVIEPEALVTYPPGALSFEYEVFPDLLGSGRRVEGFAREGAWVDLGTPQRYQQGHRLVLDRRLKWPTIDHVPEVADGRWVSPTAVVAAGAILREPVLLLPGTHVAADAVVGPWTVLGRGASIDRGAVIERAIIHDQVRIGAGVVASGLIAGFGANVETGARLGRDVLL